MIGMELSMAAALPPPMHAPDGFFAVWLSVLGWVIMLAVIGLAVKNTGAQLGERQVPLMGVLAAAIFAGQMLNFTIPGGTSGHLLGGALAAIILGPWAGVLVITAVVMVQALMFQDGGLLAMGLNVINMGVLTALSGYFTYRGITRFFRGKTGGFVGAMIAGWLSVMITSAFVAVELALSGVSALQIALPAMLGVHALIGIGEGLLTAFALGFIATVRADLLEGERAPGQRSAAWVVAGLLLALGLTLLAPLASPYSDGLERVAEVLSNPAAVEAAQAAPYQIMPDYTLPALGSTGTSTILAGMIGVLLVFGVASIAARISKRGTDHHTHSAP